MAETTSADRLRCFLAVEQAEGATDDAPVIDGIDTLTFGDLRGVLAERDDAVGTVERWTPELRDKRNDLLDIRGILSPPSGPRRVPPGVEMVPAAAPAVLWIADELDRVRGDLADVRAEADALVNNLAAARAERDQLRRQLDAAEAQPCDHDSDAFQALERLHSRIHRDFNFDASECAPPTEDEPALRMMDDLVTFADEVYLPLADATKADTRTASAAGGAFWDDLNRDLEDPEFRAAFEDAVSRLREPGPLESAVTEALADIATTPADPEPAPATPPWLIEAGDD